MFNETYRQMKYRIRKDSYKKCVKLKVIMLALLGVFFYFSKLEKFITEGEILYPIFQLPEGH